MKRKMAEKEEEARKRKRSKGDPWLGWDEDLRYWWSDFLRNLRPVLPARYTDMKADEELYATKVAPKMAQRMSKYLYKHAPLPPEYGTLKRIRKESVPSPSDEVSLQVLIGPSADAPFLQTEEWASFASGPLVKVAVNTTAPNTMEQFQFANERWPLCVAKPLLSREAHTHLKGLPESGARALYRLWDAYHRDMTEGAPGQFFGACVSDTGSTYGVLRDDHGCSFDGPAERNPLDHLVMRLIATVAEANRAEFAKLDGAPTEAHPYLCRGCYVFLSEEPCVMCSMALLHSRVGIVIYERPRAEDGGMGSRYFIHDDLRLNHRFLAFEYTAGPGPPG